MEEWKTVKLGDYILEYTEKTTVNNQYPILTSSRKGLFLQSDYYKKQIASENNIGYNIVPYGYFTYRHMSDDEIFKFNINTIVENGIVSTLYPVFTTKNLIDKWLLYTLNYGSEFSKYARMQKQGGSRTYMYLEKLKKIKLTFPPIKEQEKIAEILSTQDKVIELKQKLIDRKKQQKKWLMQNLLTGRIRLKGFEGEWKKISFNIICDKISDGIHGTPKYDLNGDYYFINGNNLRNGKIIITESTKRVNESEYEKYKKTLCNRTILLSINGTIGSTAIYKNEPILLGKSSAYLNIKNKYDFNFIFHAINSNYIQSHFIKKLTGSTIKNLSIDTIKNTQIFIPPIEEQTAIAEILSAQDREIELLEKELEQEKLKKKALMQMLLTGKVRVI